MACEPIHPGETLRDDFGALGMSVAELARRIEVSVNRITEILNGRRAVTGDTALRLRRFFGTSGEFWLDLQKRYELRRAEEKNGAAIARLPTLEDAGGDLHAAGYRSAAGGTAVRTAAEPRWQWMGRNTQRRRIGRAARRSPAERTEPDGPQATGVWRPRPLVACTAPPATENAAAGGRQHMRAAGAARCR